MSKRHERQEWDYVERGPERRAAPVESRDRSCEPRTLPVGETECPTCGAATDHDAEVLYGIERVTEWLRQTSDPEGRTIYQAAIDELRASLRPTPLVDARLNALPASEPTHTLGEALEEAQRQQELRQAVAEGFEAGFFAGQRADRMAPLTQRMVEAATRAWSQPEQASLATPDEPLTGLQRIRRAIERTLNEPWTDFDPYDDEKHHVDGMMRAIEAYLRAPESSGERHRWCRNAGPGRGDCEHFVGLPVVEDESTCDEYGIPHGWCDYCWAQEIIRRLRARLSVSAEPSVTPDTEGEAPSTGEPPSAPEGDHRPNLWTPEYRAHRLGTPWPAEPQPDSATIEKGGTT